MPEISSMASLDKSLALLTAIVEDGGNRPFQAISMEAGMPLPTAYRIAAALKKRGFLESAQRGNFVPGRKFQELAVRASTNHILAAASRPVLRKLALRTGKTVHMGVLEDDMVTYIVKEPAAEEELFTREGMQLEAYCSAIGKVLLAGLPNSTLAKYAASGPFYALTGKTITDPDKLLEEFDKARESGFSTDDAEVEPELHCIAVLVMEAPVPLAVSIAAKGDGVGIADLLPHLADLRRGAQALRPLLSRFLVLD